MPAAGTEALPDRQTTLLASGGESVLVSVKLRVGAYKFPTTDSRDDVGFLGSLPLSPLTKSKPVTPWIIHNRSSLAHRAGRATDGAAGRGDPVADLLAGLVPEGHGGSGAERAAGEHEH